MEEKRQEIIKMYDEWIQKEEKRGISYGELVYIEKLSIPQLEEIKKELESLLY